MSSSLPLRNTRRNRRDHHHTGVVSDLFSQLPNELKSNILSRLPLKLLLQLRCFIDDPYARKLSMDPVILESHSDSNVVSFLTLVQSNDDKDCRFHFANYNDVRHHYKLTKPIRYPPLNIRNKGTRTRGSGTIIVGSCNGLVCYVDYDRTGLVHLYVFNPVTRERLNITPLGSKSVLYGFGYHPVTEEYKVVQIYYDGEEGEVEVYTLGTGVWRSVGKVPSDFKDFSDSHGVLVNGALYWHDYHNHIASFDLATETFKHVPSPSSFKLVPMFDDSSYGLWAWRESVCVVKHNYAEGVLDIWVRNNNDQSWGKELSVPFLDSKSLPNLSFIDTDLDHDDCTFITRTKSGKVLQWYNNKLLASYDLRKEKRIVYGENKPDYFNDIVLHVKSFVSLKELGEVSEIMEGKNLCFLTLVQIDKEKHGRFHLAEYDDVTDEYTVTQPVTHHPLINLTNKGIDNIIVGSCNGLVCYADHHRIKFDPIHVFNPVTNELLNLTPLGSVSKLYSTVVNGFGYHPVTKEYKVVRIYYDAKKGAGGEVEVYTLGTGAWRRVGKVPSLFHVFHDYPGVLVNGALHWYDYKGSIASFDLATEIFQPVPSPLPLKLVPDESLRNWYNLCALREHLCVIHHFKNSRIDIWELNKDQSWRMEFSFAVKADSPLCANDESLERDCCTPITLSKSGKVLLWYNYKIFASYDPKNRELSGYTVYKAGHFNEIVVHVKSFVSLKALGEKNAKVIN